jgi:hypothetical protein
MLVAQLSRTITAHSSKTTELRDSRYNDICCAIETGASDIERSAYNFVPYHTDEVENVFLSSHPQLTKVSSFLFRYKN